MGQLIESAWNLDDKCRFKVLPYGDEKPPCNPPAFEEPDADVPGSLGLSKFDLLHFSHFFILMGLLSYSFFFQSVILKGTRTCTK